MICRHERTEFYGVTGDEGVCADGQLFGYQEALYPFFGRCVRVKVMGGWTADFEYLTRVEALDGDLNIGDGELDGFTEADVAPFTVAGKHFHAIVSPEIASEITVAFDDPDSLGEFPWDELTEAWHEIYRNAEASRMGPRDVPFDLVCGWRTWDGGEAREGALTLRLSHAGSSRVVAVRHDLPDEENYGAQAYFHRLMDDEGWAHEPLAVSLGGL